MFPLFLGTTVVGVLVFHWLTSKNKEQTKKYFKRNKKAPREHISLPTRVSLKTKQSGDRS